MRGKEKLWRQTWILPVLMLLMTAFLWRGVQQVNAETNPEEATTQEETQLPTIEVTQYIDGEEYAGQWQYLPLDIGSEHTLSVEAVSSDGSEPIYEWRDSNGNIIGSKDSDTVTIKKGIGYEYYEVTITTENGGYTWCSFSLYPEETLQVTQWIGEEQTNYASCQPGEPVTFAVQAESSYEQDNIRYQWYENNDNQDNKIEGAVGSQYTVEKQNIGSETYSCEVDDGNYTMRYYFNVDMGETLSYTLQINGQDYTEGVEYICTEDSTYTLSVNARTTVSEGTITYQWCEINENNEKLIEEANEASLVVSKPEKRKQYYCKVFDGNKEKQVWFTLYLGDTLSVKQYMDSYPYNGYAFVEYRENENCQLEVRADSSLGKENITYQWFYYDENEDRQELDNNSAIYNYSMQPGKQEIYCDVSDGNCTETLFFRLTTPKTLSTEQYINGKHISYGYFINGDVINLEVQAETTPGNSLEYRWYKDYWSEDGGREELAEVTGNSLTITKEKDTPYSYVCIVSDGSFTETCGFSIYTENTLSLTGYINDDEYNSDRDYYFAQGDKVTLTVVPDSGYKQADFTYEWTKETEDDSVPLEAVEGQPNVCTDTMDPGYTCYECTVSDGNSQNTYYFELYEDVNRPTLTCIPYIDGVRYLEDEVYKEDCKKGESFTLRAEAWTETAEDSITYMWQVYDGDQWNTLDETGDTITAVMSSNYMEYCCTIRSGNSEQELSYYLRVEGTASSDGELQIIPYVDGEWSSEIEGVVGETVNLSIEVVDAPENLTYQWFKDSGTPTEVAIKGAIEPEYNYTIQKGITSLRCDIYEKDKEIGSMGFLVKYDTGEKEDTLTARGYIDSVETTYVEFKPGEELTLSVDADSTTDNAVSYKWYDDNEKRLGTGEIYTITPTKYQSLYCKVSDGVSELTLEFELDMVYTWSAAQYIDGIEATEKVCEKNKSVTLEIKTEGESTDELTYKWLNNKNNLLGSEPSLEVSDVKEAATYRCKVSDGYRTEVYRFYLKPEGSISFEIDQYINDEETNEIYLAAGETAELKVDASGTIDGISYRWYISKDGTAYKPLETSQKQTITGDNSNTFYICVIRVGTVEKTVYFNAFFNDTPGEHIHQWNNGVITKQPTQTETGIKTYTCLTCGETKEEILDKLPSTTEDTKPTGPSSPTTQTKPSTQTPQKSPSAQTPAASQAPAIGATLVSSDKKTTYKVTGSNTVEYKKTTANKAKVTIPSTVTYQGRKYQVTSIAAKAFRNNKKLKKVVIPSTVRKIGKQAFVNCKKLKNITIKANKLTAKSIGSKAFKGINPKATIKVPKKKLKLYKKILRTKGVSASVRIK